MSGCKVTSVAPLVFEAALLSSLHLSDVRGFLILTAAVILVIGVGAGVLGATSRTPTSVECASVRGCVGIARAFGIDKQLVTPTNPDLRFEEGLVFPPPRPMGWTVFLMFGDSQQSEALEWWMSSERPISYTDCFHIMHEVPLEAAGGLRFCELAGGGQAPLPASSRRDRTER